MLKSIKKMVLAVALATVAGMSANAQVVGVKTNLLYDATTTVNLGLEFGLAPKWSFDLSGNIKTWNLDEQVWKHWMLQPEARYWFCDAFAGHFIGFHAITGQFNWGNFRHASDFLGTRFSMLKDYRAQGWAVGAGVAYGYTWVLGKHWNFEAEIGIGWIHTWHDVYECKECARKIASDREHNYYGPTKAALNLVYVF
ncbi:MAG: DUF3575 domain-containing protein [Alistipes sp.]|nr:DUF3575 domain-containing protein [Alistipes sp.]